MASLFRNFLLAERVMRSYGCTPTCFPPLPPTFQHPLWRSWDLAVENCLAQLPDLLGLNLEEQRDAILNPPPGAAGPPPPPKTRAEVAAAEAAAVAIFGAEADLDAYAAKLAALKEERAARAKAAAEGDAAALAAQALAAREDGEERALVARAREPPTYLYAHSSFFADQLTAFELWLQFGAADGKPPEQLPVVLQVLLSQMHRYRALVRLGQFLARIEKKSQNAPDHCMAPLHVMSHTAMSYGTGMSHCRVVCVLRTVRIVSITGPWALGGQPRAAGGHLPVRAQAAAEPGAGAAQGARADLGQDPGAGPVVPGRPDQGRQPPVLRAAPGGPAAAAARRPRPRRAAPRPRAVVKAAAAVADDDRRRARHADVHR